MDYRRFLAAPVEEVYPYFGGPFVVTGERRLRLIGDAEPGYWRFEVTGRNARPLAAAEPPDLSGLPAVRGYAVAAYLVSAGGTAERLGLAPPDEPLPFTPIVARRWPTGELLFDAWDFESGVEDEVRHAYDDRSTLAGVRGASAALRAAFGYAVLLRTAREVGVPARPAEARAHLAALADEGEQAARRILGLLDAQRAAEREAARTAAVVAASPTPEWIRARDEALSRRASALNDRVADALYAARAGLRGLRRLAGNQIEVRYDLDGEHFVSIVDIDTLQVVDAGICLSGSDRELTLESLPAVIREAMRTGRLNITNW
jgi:hypothetical protein